MAGAVAGKVLAYLAQCGPGQVINVEQVAAHAEISESQAKTAMYRIVRGEKWPVEVIATGELWRNLAAAQAEPEADDGSAVTFDVIEHLGGALVLRDADGALWLAKRIGTAE